MSEPKEPDRGECERCGEFDTGKTKLLFHHDGTVETQFFCWGCLRTMRLYAGIGFSLLFLLVAGIAASVFWLSR